MFKATKGIQLLKTYKSIIKILPENLRRHFKLIAVIGLLRPFLDLVGLATIFPVIQILVSPEIVQENKFLNELFQSGQYESITSFAFMLMMCALLFFALKTMLSYFMARYQSLVAYNIVQQVALTRFQSYLHMPYSFYLKSNSGVLIRNFLFIPFEFGQRIIIPFIQLISEMFLVILLLVVIVFYKPVMFILLAIIMAPAVAIYQSRIKNYLKDISVRKDLSSKYMFKQSSQSMGVYREIILHNNSEYFKSKFGNGVSELASLNSRIATINEFSPKITEFIAVLGIAVVFSISIFLKDSNSELVHFLIVFALIISRLLPSANRIILQSTTIRANEFIFEYLNGLQPFNIDQQKDSGTINTLSFNDAIHLQNVCYKYDDNPTLILSDITLTITKGSSIGFVGPSGSGKTTLINILLRLLEETSGTIRVDSERLNETNKTAWYRLIGFVPQNINILDGDFIDNIAFGVSRTEIDLKRVEKVVEIAQLKELVESQPNKYHTNIGEGGMKISGGQRQRIGIARALYHDAQILIFDEATSALDAETEEMITESLRLLSENKITTIVVAHRLQTLRYCDAIYKLEKGKLSGKLKYSDL